MTKQQLTVLLVVGIASLTSFLTTVLPRYLEQGNRASEKKWMIWVSLVVGLMALAGTIWLLSQN